ncbi:hypothetical protein NKH45_35325 [Mesorhizobium sp. M1156]|uniref:thermonuclease family protein n=1 Tax=Mesorhizobium sp. M1156 TaxID=2957064 RepID=UPI003339F6AC
MTRGVETRQQVGPGIQQRRGRKALRLATPQGRVIDRRFRCEEASRFVRAFGFALALVIGSLIYSYIDSSHTASPSSPALALPDAGTLKPLARSQFTITDGDTIRLKGAPKGTRLVGFNTPESIEPRCDAEADLGHRAKARLKELVAAAKLERTHPVKTADVYPAAMRT